MREIAQKLEVSTEDSSFLSVMTSFAQSYTNCLFDKVEFIDGVCLCDELNELAQYRVFSTHEIYKLCDAARVVYNHDFSIIEDYIDGLGHHVVTLQAKH